MILGRTGQHYLNLDIWVADKGTFYSESAGEMWNRHTKVPKIAPELFFPINGMNCSDKIAILSFFCINQINLFQANISMYSCYNQ